MPRLVYVPLSRTAPALGVALCVAASFGLSGCGASESDSAAGGADGPVILAVKAGGDAPAAQVQGKLQLRDGCLVVGDYPIAWTTDATWDVKSQAVGLGNAEIAVGSAVSTGGGFYGQSTDWRATVLDSAEAAIDHCLKATGASEFAVAY